MPYSIQEIKEKIEAMKSIEEPCSGCDDECDCRLLAKHRNELIQEILALFD